VRAEIPRELYMAIVKLQAAEDLDWPEACIKAARLLNSNSEEFKRIVQLEAERLYKQRLMRQLNKARETVRTTSEYPAGYAESPCTSHPPRRTGRVRSSLYCTTPSRTGTIQPAPSRPYSLGA